MKRTKMLFIQKEIVPIGVMYLSSYLKAHGYRVRLAYFNDPFSTVSYSFFPSDRLYNRFLDFLLHTIRTEQPDLIGFSTFTMNYRWAVSVAQFLKQHVSTPIIFGGYHATMAPEVVIKEPAIDMLCIGEGEQSLLDLMDALETGRDPSDIKNLWSKKSAAVKQNNLYPLLQNLDQLPFPDMSVMKHTAGSSYLILGSRGCPFHCTYCANNYYSTLYPNWHKVRFRSVENVLAEIESALAQLPLKRLEFMDDIVAYSNERIEALFRNIQQRFQLPYSCFLHPKLVNEETIRILKETNCFWLKIGVQTTNEENRKAFLSRPETNAQLRKVAAWCREHGLCFSFDHIFSLPCDSADDLIESVRFYNDTRPQIINYGSLVYLPKTEIVNQALEKNILTADDVQDINQGSHVTATTSNVRRLQGEGEKDKSLRVLIGRVAYLYSLISFRSQQHVERMLSRGFLTNPHPLSPLRIVAAKFMAKFMAKQFYIYWWVLRSFLLAPFKRKYFVS